jgi:acyl-CoA synthetase (AMP-forming)/AMP-acid ligase II
VVSDKLAGFPIQWLEDLTLPVALKISVQHHLMVKPDYQICQTLAEYTNSQGYLDTQDLVEVKDDRVLFIGRSTGVINVGGNKVYPEKIEQIILQCPDINQARVYAKKSTLMGELVVADITITQTDDPKLLKQQVLKLCKNQLQRFEIPTKINIVNEIIHDPSGKLNRHINRKPNGKQEHD